MMDAPSKIDTLLSRLDTLETQLAYQVETIEDLNQTITAQWKQIDGLSRQLAMLMDRVQEAEARAGTSAAPEPPPPHY